VSARRLLRILVALGAMLWAGSAYAACYQPNQCSCIVSVSSMSFGTYDPQSPSPNDTVGTLSVSCVSGNTGASTFSIALSPGGSGNANARAMTKGSYSLYYNLFTNVARTIVWGDDNGGGESVASSFPAVSRTAKQFSVYGRIPSLQNAAVGIYHDAITVTVTY
jgi:spore coat protein U-like protein